MDNYRLAVELFLLHVLVTVWAGAIYAAAQGGVVCLSALFAIFVVLDYVGCFRKCWLRHERRLKEEEEE